eukprot:SAG11_NODE_536_length_8674_cov_6.314985_2_plen_101_part_00
MREREDFVEMGVLTVERRPPTVTRLLCTERTERHRAAPVTWRWRVAQAARCHAAQVARRRATLEATARLLRTEHTERRRTAQVACQREAPAVKWRAAQAA